MITPAVLISASAGLIFSTANRLGRIFDRVNALKTEAEGTLGKEVSFPKERLAYLGRQLHTQSIRAGLIQKAMVCLYSATAFFIISSLTLAFSMIEPSLDWLVTTVALMGGLLLLSASALLLYESRYNLRFIRGQIDFISFLSAEASKKEAGFKKASKRKERQSIKEVARIKNNK